MITITYKYPGLMCTDKDRDSEQNGRSRNDNRREGSGVSVRIMFYVKQSEDKRTLFKSIII